MNKNTDAAKAASGMARKPYVSPACQVVDVEGDALLTSVSNGWTTSDRSHGQGIVEEDAENPYSDEDF